MKKLKNIFLLGFLICLSIFLGINISFLAYSYNADFSYNLMTSDVQENGMHIEKNYFKSKYFNQKVMNSILTNLKYSVIDSENEDKYSSNAGAMGSYYYDYNVLTDEWSTVNYGGYPNQNYQSGSAVINLYYVHTNPTWKIQNTIMHEMGHIFRLKHSTTTVALMVSNSASYTELTLPQSDDISGVRAIYE